MSSPKQQFVESLLIDKTRLIELPFFINNKHYSAIIDTGSRRNIISYNFVKHLNLKLYKCEEKIRLKVVNGKIVIPEYEVIFQIKIDLNYYTIKALVIDNFGYNLLLSLNFLEESKAKLDFQSRTITINDSSFPLPNHFVSEEEDKPLRTITDEKIPPNCEKIIKVRGPETPNLLLIEPNNASFEKFSIAVARTICKSKPNGDILVRVANPQNFPVTIPAKSTIARGFDVVSVCDIKPKQKIIRETCLLNAETVVSGHEADIDDLPHQSTNKHMKSDEEVLNDLDINPTLSMEQKSSIRNMFRNYMPVLSRGDLDIGLTSYISHHIETGDADPIRKAPYRRSFAERKVMKDICNDLATNDIIEETDSPWASPVVLVRKRDGTWRFCVDWRELNKVTKKDSMPLPRIDDTLDRLSGSQYFTKIDLTSGYYQVELNAESRAKTAFVTPDGHYQFKRLGMGLCNAPATFQRLMYKVLGNMLWTNSMAYLDDIVIFSKTFDQHMKHVEEVLIRLNDAGLKLKPKKCSIARKSLPYLGHIVSGYGVAPDPDNTKALKNYPAPRTVKQVQEFLGLTSYYRRFIEDFSTKSKPLNQLIKKGKRFEWTEECQIAFDTLRKCLLAGPILTHPDFTRPFMVYTDASAFGLGAILKQIDDNGHERTISYASRVLSQPEQNYSATERECLAVVFATQKFRPYLYGTKFTIVTDHCALCWLRRVRNPNGRLARWGLILQDFDYDIVYKSGRKHLDADALSRNPVVDDATETGTLPSLVLNEEDVASIRNDQHQEEWIRNIMYVLENPQASHSRNIKRQARCFAVKEGLLHRRIWTNQGIKVVLVVPRTMYKEVLETLHDKPAAGHLGISKTWNKIKTRYFWPRMYSMVVNYVQSCSKCNQKKTSTHPQVGHLQPLPPVTKPFARIGFDKLGPFPESIDRNKHVWVVTDYATRMVFAASSPNGTAAEAAKFLHDKIINVYGAPKQLLTDRGKEFCNEMFEHITKLHSINHTKTTAYHPRTNGLTERFNKTLADMMSHYVSEDHKDWDRFLPFLVQAYNTSIHDTTGYSPFFLLHGFEPDLMIDQALALPNENLDEENTFDFETMVYRDKARQMASDRVEKSQEKSKIRFNETRTETNFKTGDLVWVKFPNNKVGRAKKLLHQYRGPYQLCDQTAPNNFEIMDAKGKTEIMNVDRFKLYHHRSELSTNTETNISSATTDTETNTESPETDTSLAETTPKQFEETAKTVSFSQSVETIDENDHTTMEPLTNEKEKLDVFPSELIDPKERIDTLFEPIVPETEIEQELEPIENPRRRSSRVKKQTNLNAVFLPPKQQRNFFPKQ